MDREVTMGSIWTHFMGVHVATVIAVATYTETSESLVVYEGYDNDKKESCGVFACPMQMFLSEVDKTRYPNATQKYRFEKQN